MRGDSIRDKCNTGISTDLVSGTELLTLIEPDYMIPTATISERIRQKTMEEGM
jgi:hypothetical protein